MRRRWGAGGLLVALLLAVAVASGGGTAPARAAGVAVTEVGWWSATPSTTTPAGGFQVARSPNGGDQSVAAIRIGFDGNVTKALLVLVEATGGSLKEGASIDACPTTAPWTPIVAGPLADAPAADCTNKLALTRNGTTGTWTADLLPLFQGASGTLSVVLKPGAPTAAAAPTAPAPNSPVGGPIPTAPPTPTVPVPVDPGFTVEFGRADVDGASVEGGTDETAAGPSSSSSSSSGSIATGSTDATSTFSPTFSSFNDTFARSAAPSVTPTASALPSATGDVAVGGAGGVGTAANVESGLQPVAAAAARGEPAPWGRLLVLIPLSLACGAVGTGVRRLLAAQSVGGATAS